jgi:GAF domain-containing protein
LRIKVVNTAATEGLGNVTAFLVRSGDSRLTEHHLLQCVVEVARSVFRAEASSVFVVDGETGDLVFEAVAGRGEDRLIGTRIGRDTGIAGWVLASAQPLIADDLSDSAFSQAAAEATGYVPKTIVAAPLICGGEVMGVLEVLDRGPDRTELETLELLGLLAAQAAAGIELVQLAREHARADTRKMAGSASNGDVIDRISAGLPNLDADESRLLGRLLALADDITVHAASRKSGGRAIEAAVDGAGKRG